RCLVAPHMSHPGGCRLARWSGRGRVSDLGELGPQPACADPRLVVGDAHAPGCDVHGHPLDARLAGKVAFDAGLAFAAGDVRRGQFDRGRAHVRAPMPAGACGGAAHWLVGWKRRSRSALPMTVTELAAMASAASTGGKIPAAASGTRSRL